MDKLPLTIIQHVYEYDSTYKHIFDHNMIFTCITLALVRGREGTGSVRFVSLPYFSKIYCFGSDRFGNCFCPVRCSSACAFWTRHGSVWFGSAFRSGRIRNSTARFGSVRQVRFGWLNMKISIILIIILVIVKICLYICIYTRCICVYMYIHIYIYIYICIHICMERERERDVCVCMCTYTYNTYNICICIHVLPLPARLGTTSARASSASPRRAARALASRVLLNICVSMCYYYYCYYY